MKNLFYTLLIFISLVSCTKAQNNENAMKTLDKKSNTELYKMATDLYDKIETNEALPIFQKCIDRNYKIDTCYFKLGVCYIDIGQPKIGIEKLENAIKVNPNYFKAIYNIAATYYDNLEFQKSIDYYQKALLLEPKDDSIYYGIAASQFAQEKYNDAAVNCTLALKLNAKNENASTLLDCLKRLK